MNLQRSALSIAVLFVVCLAYAHTSKAQESTSDAKQQISQQLAQRQTRLAAQILELEKTLLRSSELEALENPTRAALLRQAVQLSKEVQLAANLAEASKALGGERYSDAITRQQQAGKHLSDILQLLQSENRSQRVREEREKVRRWIEETDRLLRMQGALRGRTEGGQNMEAAEQNQQRLSEKAQDIADDLQGTSSNSDAEADDASDPPETPEDNAVTDQANERTGDEPKSDSEPSDNDSSDGNAAESPQSKSPSTEPGEAQSENSQNSESQSQQQQSGNQEPGDQQPGSQQSGDQQQTGDQQQSGDQQSGGQQQSGDQRSSPQQPERRKSATEKAGEQLRAAQQKMREAQEALKNAEREGAVEKQLEAEEELREAVAELEQILQQLREEEIERSLASLETRLRTMLELQNTVLAETQRLQEIGGEGPDRQIVIRANKLSLEQQKVLLAGERAYNLLREEGSSAAFPEAILQVNTDAQDVIGRLSEGDVGPMTVLVEEDIVTAIEEMLTSLEQVKKDNEKRKQQQRSGGGGGGGGGGSGEQPLVNKLAELRLIKTLQIRINKRTRALAELLEDSDDPQGQVTESDVLEQVRELAKRELKVQKVTLDIAGKR
ncbi:MAG TPA: hypothetical protein DDW52_06940 [Planctomycetaceae bacterium]|nr:hypothetical protein [Planctomycetaceae bacterium]